MVRVPAPDAIMSKSVRVLVRPRGVNANLNERVAGVSLRGPCTRKEWLSYDAGKKTRGCARHAMRVLTRSFWEFVGLGVLHVRIRRLRATGVGVVWERGKSPVLRGIVSI